MECEGSPQEGLNTMTTLEFNGVDAQVTLLRICFVPSRFRAKRATQSIHHTFSEAPVISVAQFPAFSDSC